MFPKEYLPHLRACVPRGFSAMCDNNRMTGKKIPPDQMTEAELEELAFHNISVARLVKLSNPMGAWMELESPIEKNEVMECLAQGKEKLCHTPLWSSVLFGKDKGMTPQQCRENHIAKIAYFVKNPIEKPISMDVGVPSMGHTPGHLIDDGHHRLAGSFIAGRRFIPAHVGGEVSHAKSLGLWKPNRYQAELDRRWEASLNNRSKSTPGP